MSGGGGGIRTHGAIHTHDFQSCPLGHYGTPPWEMTKKMPAHAVQHCGIWRREWDSNPRYLLEHTAFRGQLLKPLGHLSVMEYTI
jgi:hypothetical protein